MHVQTQEGITTDVSVVYKCAFYEKGFPFEGKLSTQLTDEVDT